MKTKKVGLLVLVNVVYGVKFKDLVVNRINHLGLYIFVSTRNLDIMESSEVVNVDFRQV